MFWNSDSFFLPTEIHKVAAVKEGIHRQWMLPDKHVGARCLSLLLGLGYNRLHALCHGRVDLRYKAFGFVPCTKISNLPAMLFPVAVSKLLEAVIEVRRPRANKRRKADMHAAGMLPDKPLVFVITHVQPEM